MSILQLINRVKTMGGVASSLDDPGVCHDIQLF